MKVYKYSKFDQQFYENFDHSVFGPLNRESKFGIEAQEKKNVRSTFPLSPKHQRSPKTASHHSLECLSGA